MKDATLLQQTFLARMSVEQINHTQKMETNLKALCEANGVKFRRNV